MHCIDVASLYDNSNVKAWRKKSKILGVNLINFHHLHIYIERLIPLQRRADAIVSSHRFRNASARSQHVITLISFLIFIPALKVKPLAKISCAYVSIFVSNSRALNTPTIIIGDETLHNFSFFSLVNKIVIYDLRII